jgi:phosphatidylglycerophosphate synthase
MKGMNYYFSLFFIISMLMDGLDGLLSRELKLESELGKHLDSLADFLVRAMILLSFFMKFQDKIFIYVLSLYLFYVAVLAMHHNQNKKMLFWFHFELLVLFFPIIKRDVILAIFFSEIFYLPLILWQFIKNILLTKPS